MLSPYGTNTIVGDFNLEDIDWSNMDVLGYNSGQFFSKFVLENGLHQHVFVLTRDTLILGLVLTDNSDIISDVHVTAKFSTSDHASVLVNLNFEENLKHKQIIYTPNFKNAKWTGMHDMLASINSQMILALSLISRHAGTISMILNNKLFVSSYQFNVLTPFGVLNVGFYQ